MAEQPSLFADAVPPRAPTDRLFFAIFPPPDAAEAIDKTAVQLRADMRLRGKPLLRERFHTTVNHLGDHAGVPAEVVANAAKAAEAVKTAPFDATYEFIESFRGRRGNLPCVMRGKDGVRDRIAFQQALGLEMGKAGLSRWVEKRFVPHVTLLYDDMRVTNRPIAPLSWRVNEFVLVHSLLGQTKHIILGRWSLRG